MTFRLALAQVNLHVGDVDRNTCKMLEFIKQARDVHHADLVVFPELSITGYPPEDLLYRPALRDQIRTALDKLLTMTESIDVIAAFPEYQGDRIFNACSYLSRGKSRITCYKQELPNYSVFDEKRYFTAGSQVGIFELNGIPAALSICEDIWQPSVCKQAAQAGAKLMININASPFHIGKLSLRKHVLEQRVAESGLNLVYVNLVGGQDELVFDGGSLVMNAHGKVMFQAPQFEEGLYIMEINPDNPDFFSRVHSATSLQELSDTESVYHALVLGIRDYVHKNGFKGGLIGLSGGIDSALTLCLAVDALGKDNVEVIIMPSRYTSNMSIEDATSMSNGLGVRSHLISIEPPFIAFNESLKNIFAGLPADATEENIQSRCRGIILMAISNKTGKLVLTTGNKSEMAVGYATLYGDMAGGFAPLKDISKTLVYKLSCWRNEKERVIPQRIIDRPPTAELRENQLDEDSLPPYDILDPILERYIELDQSPGEIIKSGFDRDTVKKVVGMVDRSEYKRRQSAPGVKITQRAFGRDRRYPITSGYREE